MHTIKVNLSDGVFDKVMQFLQKLPKDSVWIYENKRVCDDYRCPDSNDLVDFFQSSPLKDIELVREDEVFSPRTEF